MVDQVAVVTFTTPTTAIPFPVTSPLITEPFSAAILIFTHETSDGTDNTHAVIGAGFIGIDSSLAPEVGMACLAGDGRAAAPQAKSLHHNAVTTPTRCMKVPLGTNIATLDIEATYSASIAGGVELNFTNVASGPIQTKCTAILFAGLARAATGSATSSTVGVPEDVGLSPSFFQPDVLCFLSSDGSLNTTNIADAALNLGLVVRGGNQITSYVNVDDVTEPTDADGIVLSSKGYMTSTRTAGAMNVLSVAIAITSTGFTATSSSGSPDSVYLALKFSGVYRAACVNAAVAAATGLQNFTGFGFTPNVVFGMATALAAVDTNTDGATASAAGFFATGGQGSRAYTVHHKEGINIPADGNSSAHTRQEDVAELLYDHTGAVVHRATWAGPITSGFALDYSVASQVGFLTMLGLELGLSTFDTEQTSDSVVLIQSLIDPETEEITDSLVANASHVLSEAEQISEELVMAGTLVLPETEELDESLVLVSETVTRAPSTPMGWTY